MPACFMIELLQYNPMADFLTYMSSDDFVRFLDTVGIWLILSTILFAFIALFLELRLPLRYYWGLPAHLGKSLLAGLHILTPDPVWGRCYAQDTQKGLPLVACDLMDEHTHRIVKRTYSNHQGEYGFPLIPGKYLLRATKTHYRLPGILDPENVQIIEVDEAYVASVAVVNREVVPYIDLPLVPVKKITELTVWELLLHYSRMFLFQLANAFLVLAVALGLAGWYATRQPVYGVIIAVCVVLLFIKLYILELIRIVGKTSHA
jgi:hypothetical protein